MSQTDYTFILPATDKHGQGQAREVNGLGEGPEPQGAGHGSELCCTDVIWPKPYYEHAGVTIYHGDCSELLPKLRRSVRLVLTDPPYNVGMSYGLHRDRMGEADYLNWLGSIFSMSVGLGADSLIWFWQGIRLAGGEALACLPPGMHLHHIGAWFKREFAGDLWKGGYPAYSWEPIIWAAVAVVSYYGPVGGHDGRDGIVSPMGARLEVSGHPCPKPLQVTRAVLAWASAIGDVVLDPFMGSGTTLVAAKQLGRRAIGIEIEERYCEIAAKRLSQEVFDFTPAPQPKQLALDEGSGP